MISNLNNYLLYLFHRVIEIIVIATTMVVITTPAISAADLIDTNQVDVKNDLFKIQTTLESLQKDIQFLDKNANKTEIKIEEKSYLIEFASIIVSIFIALFSIWATHRYKKMLTKENNAENDERRKIDATNKLLLEAQVCFQNLQSIKMNYLELTSHPIERFFCIPSILMYYQPVIPEFTNLYYLAKTISRSSIDQTLHNNQNSSANIANLTRIFSKYNTLLEMWKIRNSSKQSISEELISVSANLNESANQIIEHPKLAQVIHLNEAVLSYTDDLLEDFLQLLLELPIIAESHISSETLKSYSTILKFDLSEENRRLFLKRISVDETKYEEIVGAKPIFN